MKPLTGALREIADVLDAGGIPYMIIGGIAGFAWGVQRATFDLDITVELPDKELLATIEMLGKRFEILSKDPGQFARKTSVLPIRSADGVRIDLILARLPYEHQAIQRARTVDMEGRPVRVCTPEDLIIHKIISERTKDRDDVMELIRRNRRSLDRGYLDPLVEEMATGLDRPEIATFYRGCWDRSSP